LLSYQDQVLAWMFNKFDLDTVSAKKII
jgi:hypothetical protein